MMDVGYLSEAFVSFQGEGLYVGRSQLFLRFAGCPLRCSYCDTPGSLVRTDHMVVHTDPASLLANPVSVEDVKKVVEMLGIGSRPIDGVALTGGEPLAQPGFLETVLTSGLLPRPRLLETAGTLPKALSLVIAELDVVSMDLKLPSNTGETPFWDEHERFLELAAGKAYVKILVDEGTRDDELAHATSLVRAAGKDTPVFLQPITGNGHAPSISALRLTTLFGIARAALDDVRVLPQTHKLMGLL